MRKCPIPMKEIQDIKLKALFNVSNSEQLTAKIEEYKDNDEVKAILLKYDQIVKGACSMIVQLCRAIQFMNQDDIPEDK